MGSEDQPLRVVVVYAPRPRQVQEIVLQMPSTSTVADALAAAVLEGLHLELEMELALVGIWGRKVGREQMLRTGDRVEVYRPLRVDPKIARRERFAKQGAKSAGLFAQRRAGAKAGY